MKKVLLLIAILTTANLMAAGKADFSGTWVFNEGKSTLDQMGAAFIQTKMVVKQSDNELYTAKTMSSFDQGEMTLEEKLTLDGKECASEFFGSQRVSTAVWNEAGDALTVSSTIKFDREGQTSEIKIKEIWSLSQDGKALTIKHTSTSDWGERSITIVFDRSENKN